jgi:archaemetzincin
LGRIPLIESAFDTSRNQYLSDDFLAEVRRLVNINGGNRILGVTMVDLYTIGLNFVFGQAELPGKAAIIALHRLKDEDSQLFHTRVFKEAIHELGHTIGLRHCPDKHCVMHFSNTLLDTDIKTEEYCPRCVKIIQEKNADIVA